MSFLYFQYQCLSDSSGSLTAVRRETVRKQQKWKSVRSNNSGVRVGGGGRRDKTGQPYKTQCTDSVGE